MKVQDDKLAAIKAATSLLIHRVGGAEAAAMVCRASVQVLYEYASPHRPDRVIPVDVAMQLETFLGEPVVTATLAIAERMGLTKGQVVGRAHRLNLEARPSLVGGAIRRQRSSRSRSRARTARSTPASTTSVPGPASTASRTTARTWIASTSSASPRASRSWCRTRRDRLTDCVRAGR